MSVFESAVPVVAIVAVSVFASVVGRVELSVSPPSAILVPASGALLSSVTSLLRYIFFWEDDSRQSYVRKRHDIYPDPVRNHA